MARSRIPSPEKVLEQIRSLPDAERRHLFAQFTPLMAIDVIESLPDSTKSKLCGLLLVKGTLDNRVPDEVKDYIQTRSLLEPSEGDIHLVAVPNFNPPGMEELEGR